MSLPSSPDLENPPSPEIKSSFIETETQRPTTSSTSRHVMERRQGESDASSLSRSSFFNEAMGSKNQSLTVFARHKIQPGKEQLFETWIRDISKLQNEKYPGFEGAQVVRPTCCDSQNEYLSIFRYENYDLLQTFMNSDDRHRFLEMTHEFEAAPIDYSYHSLEFLFTDETTSQEDSMEPTSGISRRPPPKFKMVLVTFLLIWLQAHFIRPALDYLFPQFPSLAVEAMTIFVIVAGTTYMWMPIVTKYILHWWLFPLQK